jgi:Zn-finger nucleic acid-binding protein
MQCPKCNGGSFLSEEELVKVIESTEPNRIVIKAVHTCMACQEKFSRLVWDDLGPHRRHMQPWQIMYQQPMQQAPNPYQQPVQQTQQQRHDEPVVDGLRFF